MLWENLFNFSILVIDTNVALINFIVANDIVVLNNCKRFYARNIVQNVSYNKINLGQTTEES